MIRVAIDLMSAITGRTTRIGCMYIANQDSTNGDPSRGDYIAAVCRRGTEDVPRELYDGDPNMPKATRAGTIKDYPRLAYNVWRLIARACIAAFPEERAPKGIAPVLDAAVMAGLHEMREVFEAQFAPDRNQYARAACAWLDAAKLDMEAA